MYWGTVIVTGCMHVPGWIGHVLQRYRRPGHPGRCVGVLEHGLWNAPQGKALSFEQLWNPACGPSGTRGSFESERVRARERERARAGEREEVAEGMGRLANHHAWEIERLLMSC